MTASAATPAATSAKHTVTVTIMLRKLKPRERALLWLAHVEESTHEEIAEALGLRPKSVRVLLFRARKRLGEVLAKRGIGPEALR